MTSHRADRVVGPYGEASMHSYPCRSGRLCPPTERTSHPQDAPNASKHFFLPYLFSCERKDMAVGDTSEPASTERAAAMRDVSYPLSPFPPFQNANASLVCVLGLGLDGTSRRAMRDVSYPLSPFPPFQNANASLVCVLGLGLDGTSRRAMRDVSYPLSPFPPFQNANASLVCVLRFTSKKRIHINTKGEPHD